MNIEQYLTSKGYKKWKTEHDVTGYKEMFQRRMDKIVKYKDYPLCVCNEKILINIDHHYLQFSNENIYDSYTMSLVHENQNGDWCDLRIYGLSGEKLVEHLEKYEHQLMDMWNVFYGQQEK